MRVASPEAIAARLLEAVDGLGDQIGVRRNSVAVLSVETRARLGAPLGGDSLAQGAPLTLDDAVTLALDAASRREISHDGSSKGG